MIQVRYHAVAAEEMTNEDHNSSLCGIQSRELHLCTIFVKYLDAPSLLEGFGCHNVVGAGHEKRWSNRSNGPRRTPGCICYKDDSVAVDPIRRPIAGSNALYARRACGPRLPRGGKNATDSDL